VDHEKYRLGVVVALGLHGKHLQLSPSLVGTDEPP